VHCTVRTLFRRERFCRLSVGLCLWARLCICMWTVPLVKNDTPRTISDDAAALLAVCRILFMQPSPVAHDISSVEASPCRPPGIVCQIVPDAHGPLEC
jgi:hypothetical protein